MKRNSQTVLNVAFNGLTAGDDAIATGAPMFWDQIDPLARQLNMRGRGQRDIIAFLRALDDPNFDRTVPQHVPSGLLVGGRLER